MAVTKVEDLQPVYFIYGKDDFLLQSALRRLRAMFEAVDPAGMDIDVFEGRTARGDEVVAAANTVPFVSPRRLVVVRGIEQMPAEEHPPLVEYVLSPSEHACLVLVGTSLPKNTRLYKALESVGAASLYEPPKKRDLARWAARLLAGKGKRIDSDAADALVAATGGDLRALDRESDKLVAYVGERESITVEDIEVVVTRCVPQVWEFVDALSARDARRSVAVAHALMLSGESPPGLLVLGLRRIRQLIAAKALRERGKSTADIMRELRMDDWQVMRLLRDAGRFTEQELIVALRRAADIEADMKTSRGDAGLVLERWALEVCGIDASAGGAGRRRL